MSNHLRSKVANVILDREYSGWGPKSSKLPTNCTEMRLKINRTKQ